MAKIRDILARSRSYSFEFFPPKTDEAAAQLDQTLHDLEPLRPSYVSVTYGAGGSTRERTHDLVLRLNRETSMLAMAHLTCAAHTRRDLAAVTERYRDEGVENILALGGDLPAGADAAPGELTYAIELVRLIREIGDFSIGVAAYPEPHPRSPDLGTDRARTAEKLLEADFAITQFFFESDRYFDLVEGLRARGVDKPVIPGIMPVLSLAATSRMAELQGSEFPSWLYERLTRGGDDPAAVRRVGIEEATRLCRELVDGGAPGLHFYTLNGSTATREIYSRLGLGPKRGRGGSPGATDAATPSSRPSME
ncbi:MAG: methylenetetrahydrofolate reductase [Gaiellales bacterium]